MLTRKDFIELANDQNDMLQDVLRDIFMDAHRSWSDIGCVDMDIEEPIHASYCSPNGLRAWLRNVNRLLWFCRGQNPNFDEGRFISYIIDKEIGAGYDPKDINGMKNAAVFVNESNRLDINIPLLVEHLEEYFIRECHTTCVLEG